jgi:hypothetical protein
LTYEEVVGGAQRFSAIKTDHVINKKEFIVKKAKLESFKIKNSNELLALS